MPLPGNDVGYEDVVMDPVWWSANTDFPADTADKEDKGDGDSRAVGLRDHSSRPTVLWELRQPKFLRKDSE
jgi:hypothetical protein